MPMFGKAMRMGMDTVELVMTVEDAFDVSLSNREIESVRTVGDLYAVVAARHEVNPRQSCLTMRAFHLLRAALMAQYDLPRSAVRPDIDLDAIVPRQGRRLAWRQFEERLGLRLPSLTLPTFAVAFSLATTVGSLLSLLIGLFAGLSIASAVLGLLLIFSKAWAMHWLTSPLANRFHIGLSTVGDLSNAVLAANYAELARRAGGINEVEMWQAMTLLVGGFFKVDPREINLDTRFIEDLGAA